MSDPVTWHVEAAFACDKELLATAVILKALDEFSDWERQRILDYVRSRCIGEIGLTLKTAQGKQE